MFPDKLKSLIFLLTFQIDKPDWRLLMDHLSKEGRIHKEELFKLVQDCNKLISNTLKIK